MSCVNTTCNCCENFVSSTSIVLRGDSIVINVPDRAMVNGQRLCVLLAQDAPDITALSTVPSVVIGINGGTYSIVQENACNSQCAVNYLYANQLKQKNGCACKRQVLKLKYGADTQLFNYVGGCTLRPSPVNEILPVPETPTV